MEREQLLEYMGFVEDMRIELADCLIPSSDFDGDKDRLRKIYGKAGELWMLLNEYRLHVVNVDKW